MKPRWWASSSSCPPIRSRKADFNATGTVLFDRAVPFFVILILLYQTKEINYGTSAEMYYFLHFSLYNFSVIKYNAFIPKENNHF